MKNLTETITNQWAWENRSGTSLVSRLIKQLETNSVRDLPFCRMLLEDGDDLITQLATCLQGRDGLND